MRPLATLLHTWPRWLPWLLILALGLGLRVWQLPGQLLADDEWHALHKLMRASPGEILVTFGHADHTIPLTLYYQFLANTIGLTEWTMRLPLLAAGIAGVAIMPWLLGKAAQRDEKLIFAALLAIAPLLVYFSRTARPYALTVLLGFTAVLAFRWWWLQEDRRWGAAYALTTVLGAWLHPLSLATTLAPFAYHGLLCLHPHQRTLDLPGLRRLITLGVFTALPLVLLLGPPLAHDFQALGGKAGVDRVDAGVLWQWLQLFAGSGYHLWALAWLGLAAVGAWQLRRCGKADFTAYLLFVTAVAVFLVAATRGAWIHHPLVLARYLLPLLPVMLFFGAGGVARPTRPLPDGVRVMTLCGALALAYAAGPLPEQYHRVPNQFTGHMAYQFDYDAERNIYNRQLARPSVPAFYTRLAEEYAPGELTLIKTPWYLEWHWNPWHLYQQTHRQHIRAGMITGLCAEDVFGEYPRDARGIDLRHMVHLETLMEGAVDEGDYLIVKRRPPRADARPIPNWPECRDMIRERLGPPIHEEDALAVYKLEQP